MHILYLLTQDLESPAGVGRYFPLAKCLVQLGHKVSIAALHGNFSGVENTHFERDGVDVWYVGQMHVRKQGNKKLYYPSYQLLHVVLRSTLALIRFALQIPADIIHIGKPHPMNSLAGIVAKYVTQKRIFLDCDDYEAATNHFNKAWQQQVVVFFEDRMPHLVNQVTTHTYFLRDRIISLGVSPDRITYLPNGVDEQRFSQVDSTQIESLRVELGLVGKKVVAFIGSLSSPSHPVQLLFDAFLRVHQILSESVLLIVGGGEEFDKLNEKARQMGLADSVQFTGRIPGAQVPAYYRLADVLVDPVYDDDAGRSRLPLKLFESWISGTPFVTADVGDRRMVLGSPPAGVLTHPGDPESLSSAILKVLSDPAFASELRERGLARAASYSWERLAKQMESVYMRALSPPKSQLK